MAWISTIKPGLRPNPDIVIRALAGNPSGKSLFRISAKRSPSRTSRDVHPHHHDVLKPSACFLKRPFEIPECAVDLRVEVASERVVLLVHAAGRARKPHHPSASRHDGGRVTSLFLPGNSLDVFPWHVSLLVGETSFPERSLSGRLDHSLYG